jgi:hypothetical protein
MNKNSIYLISVTLMLFFSTSFLKAQQNCLKGDCIEGLGIIKGKYSDNSSYTYEGNFKNGKFEGFGVFIDKNQQYEGNFKNGEYHGLGTLNGRYQDRTKFQYQGNFKNNKFHGEGKLKINNEIWVGLFNYGNQIDSLGNWNYENYFDKENIISDLNSQTIQLAQKNGHCYLGISLLSGYLKRFMLDTGASEFVLSLEDFNILKKNGLEFKKLNIKRSFRTANNQKISASFYEVYNLEIGDFNINKSIVAVWDKRGSSSLLGIKYLRNVFAKTNLDISNCILNLDVIK